MSASMPFVHTCVRCGTLFDTGFTPFCPCGGMVDVDYDLDRVRLRDDADPYVRFRELLPLAADAPLRAPDTEPTPLVHAHALGRRLGLSRLFLKDETTLPSRSTKDRMAAVALAYLHERGVRSFCTSSTGNSSSAYARAIVAYPDMHLTLFTAEEFVPRVQHADHDQVTHFGLRDATFVEAFEAARRFGEARGLVPERGFFNPGRREGLKVAFLEATDQIDPPIDWYVQAISSAMGVYGTFKAATQLHRLGRIPHVPRLLCVQQLRCAPMVTAFRRGSPSIRPGDVVARPRGIAASILRGDPTRAYPIMRDVVLRAGGDMVGAADDEIRAARAAVLDLEGISCCFSAATAVAGLIRQAAEGAIGPDDVVLLNLTGGDRAGSAPTRVRWLSRRQAGEWTPG